MPTDLESLPRASFGGILFPYSGMTIQGGVRKHMHEFWKIDGGVPEKGGRKPYVVKFQIPFHSTISARHKHFEKLFVTVMAKLRDKYEKQVTTTLKVPHIGDMSAYATDWTETLDPNMQSGMMVEVSFEEDLTASYGQVPVTPEPFDATAEKFKVARALVQPDKTVPPYSYSNDPVRCSSIMDAIEEGIQFILAMKDSSELYVASIRTRVESLLGLAAELHEMFSGLDENSYYMREALAWLHASLAAIRDEAGIGLRLRVYSVPKPMSISDVAMDIFGTTEQTMELLQLNAIESPLRIQPGTPIRYLEAVGS